MTTTTQKEDIYNILEQVSDPEVPVLSIIDLGVVRDVMMTDEVLEIVITPTYTQIQAGFVFGRERHHLSSVQIYPYRNDQSIWFDGLQGSIQM